MEETILIQDEPSLVSIEEIGSAKETTPLFLSLLDDTHQEMDLLQRPERYRCSTFPFFSVLSYGVAMPLSIFPAELSVALTLQDRDFPTHVRWVIALSSGLLVFVQSSVVIQMTFSRYYDHLKNLLSAMRHGRAELKVFMGIAENGTRKKKIRESLKNIGSFLGRESLKWTILSFSYALPLSLIEEVPYLNQPYFIIPLAIATILSTEAALHDCLTGYQPTFTQQQIVQAEIIKFREIIYQIFEQAEIETRYHLHLSESQQLYRWIMNAPSSNIDEDRNADVVLKTMLRHSQRGCQLLSQKSFRIKYLFLLSLFVGTYILGNAPNYRAIWDNWHKHRLSFMNALCTTICDTCFGFFISDPAAYLLTLAIHGRLVAFFKYEWRNIGIAVLGILVSILSIFSNIVVNRYEAVLPLIAVILATPGTLLDSSYFLIESGIRLANQRALRHPTSDNQQQRAALSFFYARCLQALKALSNTAFIAQMQSLPTIFKHHPAVLDAYTVLFHKKLPWTTGLSSTEIIPLFQKSDAELFLIINRSRAFGPKRRIIEYIASGMAGSLVLFSGLLSQYGRWPQAPYVLLPLAVPVGLACLKLSDYRRNLPAYATEHIPLLDYPQPNHSAAEIIAPAPRPSRQQKARHYALQSLQFLGGMIVTPALYYGLKIIEPWIQAHIFEESSENTEKYSEYITSMTTAVGTSILFYTFMCKRSHFQKPVRLTFN